jgi:hypothetical protein|tara:strand:- start:7 stop:567 length:561 start_codon:yes stop_codon:yes gene_type:complete
MVGTIDEFRAQLIGGGARANQFKVEINNPRNAGAININLRQAAFLCSATSLPAMSVEEIEVPFRGRTIRIAGDRDFADPWEVTFLNDTDFSIRNSMERWNNAINDLATGRGVSNTLDYCADLTVSQLDRDDRVIKVYKFVNAWPQAIAAIDLSSASATEIESFAVTFRYQHFLASDVNDGGEFAIE